MKTIEDFECHFDNFFYKASLTTKNKHLALWRVLTVFEDVAFMVYNQYLQSNDDARKYLEELKASDFMDKYKFFLKYALIRIEKECTDLSICEVDQLFNGKVYRQITKTFKRSELYRMICLHFIAIKSGAAEASINNKKISIKYKRNHEKHTFLQYTGYLKLEDDDKGRHGLEVVTRLLTKRDPQLTGKAESVCHMEGIKPCYDIEWDVIKKIYEEVSPSLIELPDDWEFPWSSLKDFRTFSRALSAINAYHIFMNFVATKKFNIRGGGVENRLLIIGEDKLTLIINNLTNLPEEIIKKIITALTYGSGVNNPDPALQPLIPYNENYILSPFSITTLNFERNALSLHIRTNKKDFDSKSSAFEKKMTENFISQIRGRFKLKSPFYLKKSKGGEIDVVLVEEQSKTIAICELKWMITPADPNEILNKIKESDHKIEQAINKATEAHKQIPYILERFDIKSSKEGWKIYPFAIFDGFPGVESFEGKETVALPQNIFFMILNSCYSLGVFCDFITKGTWLPLEGIHYLNHVNTYTFGGLQFEIQRVEMLDLTDYMFSYIPYRINED